jgi:cytochrome c oxidase subunit II
VGQDRSELIYRLREGRRWHRLITLTRARIIVLCLAGVLALAATARSGNRPAAVVYAPPPPPPLKVEVIAHLWWWEFRYPGTSIVTADEMHLPAGREIDLTLSTADDPQIVDSSEMIHEFYLPGLDEVRFVVPGQIRHVQFRSGTPKEYHGQCVTYCGLGHPKMLFLVFVDSPKKFAAWERDQKRIPMPPSGNGPVARGQRLFAGGLCTTCHAIGGVSKGTFGPNLTHLGSRTTLVGASMENTPANLKKWIEDPDRVKPGAHMPVLGLRGRQVNDLVAYLESLK